MHLWTVRDKEKKKAKTKEGTKKETKKKNRKEMSDKVFSETMKKKKNIKSYF